MTIEVKKDGNFYYQDKTGNFVKGLINPDGNSSGDLGPGFFALMCGDKKSYRECTNWTASPAK